MGDEIEDTGEVAFGATAAEIGRSACALGWRPGADSADIRLVDARGSQDSVSAEYPCATANRAALLAVVADHGGAVRAYKAGATHVLVGEIDPAALDLALRSAGRYARHLRGAVFLRREGETAETAAVRYLGELGENDPATVAAIAMTRFDTVNAAFGRDAGDMLLRQCGARIAAALPPGAVIERDDGARYMVAFHGEPAAATASVAAIEAALGRRFTVAHEAASLGAKIGVAYRVPGEAPDAVIQRAREALRQALISDGASVRVARSSLAGDAVRLAADLHHAIVREQIDILFQPQVRLDNGRIVGVEALARWEHPVHGVLGAETLFGAAERAGLELALSEHIQSLAMCRAAEWSGPMAELRLAVNVTAADLARADFPEYFQALVDRSRIDPRRVTAEVTESGFVSDLAAAAIRLDRLRATGLRIAIDDFGTGYSSLAYLKALPLDYLKIDRSLTHGIDGDPRGGVVVRGIISIARGLGLQTIAEGVETQRERELLAAEGCELYQGFLCAEPLDEQALAAMVNTRH